MYQVFVKSKQIENVCGTALVWGKVSEKGRNEVKKRYHIHDVLSLEEMVHDLTSWRLKSYLELIEEKKKWCEALFQDFAGVKDE